MHHFSLRVEWVGYSLAQEKDKYLVFPEFSLLRLLPHSFPPVKSGIRGERTREKIILIQLVLFKKWSLCSKRDSSSLGASLVLWRQPWGSRPIQAHDSGDLPPQHLPAEGTPHPGPWAGSVPATFPRRRQRRILLQPLTWSLHHGCVSQLPTFRLIQVRVRQRSLPPNMGPGHNSTLVSSTLHLKRAGSENLWLGQHPARLRKRPPF